MDDRFELIDEYKGFEHGEYYHEKLYRVKAADLIVLSSVFWFDGEIPMNPDDNLDVLTDDYISDLVSDGVKAYQISQLSGTTFDDVYIYDDVGSSELRQYISDTNKRCRYMCYKYRYIKDGVMYNRAGEILDHYGGYERTSGWVNYRNADSSKNNPKNDGMYAVIYPHKGKLQVARMYYGKNMNTHPITNFWENCNRKCRKEGVEDILYWMPLPKEMF